MHPREAPPKKILAIHVYAYEKRAPPYIDILLKNLAVYNAL